MITLGCIGAWIEKIMSKTNDTFHQLIGKVLDAVSGGVASNCEKQTFFSPCSYPS
jgi:hypothetical protein